LPPGSCRPVLAWRKILQGAAVGSGLALDAAMISLDRLLRVLNLLRKSDVSYTIEYRRAECVVVCFSLVGLPLEVEFYADKVSVHYGGRDAHDAIQAAMKPKGAVEPSLPELLITHLAA
jgi:hypothetical protein